MGDCEDMQSDLILRISVRRIESVPFDTLI